MANIGIDALDHSTLRHLCAWLDYAVRDEDRADYTQRVNAYLIERPDAIEKGIGWPEMVR